MFKTSTFRPIASALHRSVTGFDATGRPILDDGRKVGFSPIKIDHSVRQTSIRTDKSASKSRADEDVVDARLLVEPRAQLALGDILEFNGAQYRVVTIFPRYDMSGIVDHYQVDLAKWRE